MFLYCDVSTSAHGCFAADQVFSYSGLRLKQLGPPVTRRENERNTHRRDARVVRNGAGICGNMVTHFAIFFWCFLFIRFSGALVLDSFRMPFFLHCSLCALILSLFALR